MTVLWWSVQTTVTAALLAAVVSAACPLLRNRPALQHALWLIVLIKFVTPPVFSWPWSVSDVSGPLVQLFALDTQETKPPRREAVRVAAIPAAAPEGFGHPTESQGIEVHLPTRPHTPAPAAKPRAPSVASPAVQVAEAFAPWLLLGAWSTSCLIVSFVQLRRIVRYAAVVGRGRSAPRPLRDEVESVGRKLGLRAVPTVVVSEIAAPFVWCLGGRRLVWPEALASGAELARSRGVIAHELAHVRRRDHWVAWLELAAGIVWWWNPLFWLVRRRLRESAEMACDALALSALPEERRAYAEMFLELSSTFSTAAPAPVLGVGTSHRSSFERRLSMILSERVFARVSPWGFLAVGMLALGALPGWAAPSWAAPFWAGGQAAQTPRKAAAGVPAEDGKNSLAQAKTAGQAEVDPKDVDPKDVDLFEMELIAADLADAKASLARCDGDDDRQLDEDEASRLGWQTDSQTFDLDKNRKLTHLELAVYFAFRRQQFGIDRIDLVVLERMLAKYDINGDRTLSPGEIRDGRWPDEPELFDLDRNGSLIPFEIAAGLSLKRREREKSGVTGLDQRQAIEFVTRYDKNRDKAVDGEELEAAGLPFDPKEFDADDDGKLLRDEIALGYAKRREKHDIKLVDQQNALQRLTRHDRNFDQEMDEEEIMAAKWPELPDRYDLDKNKRLSRFELEAAVARQRKERGVSAEDIADATRLIGRYDKNRNGQIDVEETEGDPPAGVIAQNRVTLEAFTSFDANFDERLSRDETAAFVASQKAN